MCHKGDKRLLRWISCVLDTKSLHYSTCEVMGRIGGFPRAKKHSIHQKILGLARRFTSGIATEISSSLRVRGKPPRAYFFGRTERHEGISPCGHCLDLVGDLGPRGGKADCAFRSLP